VSPVVERNDGGPSARSFIWSRSALRTATTSVSLLMAIFTANSPVLGLDPLRVKSLTAA
jgi:hypothetical protein